MGLNASNIRFSNLLFLLIFAAHVFAMACVLDTGLFFLVKVLLCLLICVHLFYASPQPKHMYQAIGKIIHSWWYLVDQDGEKQLINIHSGSIITRYFVLLRCTTITRQSKMIYLPLFADAFDKDDFRRLRILLKANTN